MDSYNKTGLGYQPNKSFISISHDRNKSNHYVLKCKYYNKIGHLETFCYSKLNGLRWSKGKFLKTS